MNRSKLGENNSVTESALLTQFGHLLKDPTVTTARFPLLGALQCFNLPNTKGSKGRIDLPATWTSKSIKTSQSFLIMGN